MVRSLYLFVGALVLASPLTFAQSSGNTYDLGPSDYKRLGSGSNPRLDGGRLTTSYGQTLNTRNGPLPVTRNTSFSPPALSGTLKNLVRTTPQAALGSAAITGLFLGLDWLFDNTDAQWKKEGTVVLDDGFPLWCRSLYPDQCASTPEAFCNLVPGANLGPQVVSNGTELRCLYSTSSGPRTWYSGYKANNCPSGYTYSTQLGVCVMGTGLIPLTESDLSQLDGKVPALTPSEMQSLGADTADIFGPNSIDFRDSTIDGPSVVSQPGTTTTTTNDSGTTTITTTNNYHYSYGDTTVTHTHTTTVSNTYQNGNLTETSTSETPETPTVTPSPDAPPAPVIPTDCEFMPTVCAWLEWFKTPFDPPAEDEMPVIEEQDFERNYTFNLAASCPPPYTINLTLFPPVQFQWDPFCDFAVMIRPLVVGSAALFAAFIVLGIGRGRG